MSQRNETVRIVLGYLFAFFVFGGSLWLLDRLLNQLQNPDLASIPESLVGIVIGGILTLASGAATFVFGQAIMTSAARSAATATQAGINAALTPAPAVSTVTTTATPPATVSVDETVT